MLTLVNKYFTRGVMYNVSHTTRRDQCQPNAVSGTGVSEEVVVDVVV